MTTALFRPSASLDLRPRSPLPNTPTLINHAEGFSTGHKNIAVCIFSYVLGTQE